MYFFPVNSISHTLMEVVLLCRRGISSQFSFSLRCMTSSTLSISHTLSQCDIQYVFSQPPPSMRTLLSSQMLQLGGKKNWYIAQINNIFYIFHEIVLFSLGLCLVCPWEYLFSAQKNIISKNETVKLAMEIYI